MSSFHGKVSSAYLAKAEAIFSPLKKLSYERMRITQKDCVLDVGCGAGTDVIQLAGRVGLGGQVAGFDHDRSMLSEASLKLDREPLTKVVSYVQGRAVSLPFQANYFDSCRSERLFMHLLEPEHVLSEIVRVTKPGGRIVIIDTDWSSLSIDNPLPKVERVLSDYRIQHVLNNGYSGRSLYQQFRRQQLADIEVELFPVCLTDVDLFYFITMQQAIENQALADQVITQQELDDWRKALHQAAQKDCFFCSANVVMVSANKPLSR